MKSTSGDNLNPSDPEGHSDAQRDAECSGVSDTEYWQVMNTIERHSIASVELEGSQSRQVSKFDLKSESNDPEIVDGMACNMSTSVAHDFSSKSEGHTSEFAIDFILIYSFYFNLLILF